MVNIQVNSNLFFIEHFVGVRSICFSFMDIHIDCQKASSKLNSAYSPLEYGRYFTLHCNGIAVDFPWLKKNYVEFFLS
jgi:hypothetical protein